MKYPPALNKGRRLRAGSAIIGTALLLHGDSSSVELSLLQPNPEPDTGIGSQKIFLPPPSPGFGQLEAFPGNAMPRRVPSLRETLLGRATATASRHKGRHHVLASSTARSALAQSLFSAPRMPAAGPDTPPAALAETAVAAPVAIPNRVPDPQFGSTAQTLPSQADQVSPPPATVTGTLTPAAVQGVPASSVQAREDSEPIPPDTATASSSQAEPDAEVPTASGRDHAFVAPADATNAGAGEHGDTAAAGPTEEPASRESQSKISDERESAAAAPADRTAISTAAEPTALPAAASVLGGSAGSTARQVPGEALGRSALAIGSIGNGAHAQTSARSSGTRDGTVSAAPAGRQNSGGDVASRNAPAAKRSQLALSIAEPLLGKQVAAGAKRGAAYLGEIGTAPAADPGAGLAARVPEPKFGNPPAAPTAAVQSPPLASAPAELQASAPTPLQVAGGAPPELSPGDELILEMRLANGMVADTIVAYGTRSGVYFPLGALARSLDLAITVSDDGRYASGWFLDEKRTLTIDMRQKQMELLGKVQTFPEAQVVAYDGEMYVRDDYLGTIFPLAFKVDLRDQSATIVTREPFPFETRLAREEARTRLDDRRAAEEGAPVPREATPWRMLDFPLADVELRGVSDTALGTRAEGDLRLSSDLAFMTSQLFLSSSTRDGLTAARLELGRRDPDADLLGPLHATEFQIGDVSTLSLPIGLRSTSGRGAFVTNAPLQQASIFEKIDLRGELPDGYEVELYRNNVLIASTRQAVNGRYEFLQVPVEFGLNVMRLVFYGPQGQRHEEVRQISVVAVSLKKGDFVYSFGVAQKDRNLFDVYGPNFRPMRDFATWRSSAQLTYGLSSGLTGVLSAATFETDTGSHWLASGGLRTGIGNLSARLDLGVQNNGGKALQLGLGGRLLGAAATLTHTEYRGDFVDEVRAFNSDYLRRATEFNINGSLSLGHTGTGLGLPFSGRLQRLEFADGHKQTSASLRGSTRLGTLLLSNTLDFQHFTAPGSPSSTQLLGNFDLSRFSGRSTQLRAGIGYGILPSPKLISTSLEVDHAIDERTLVNGTIGHSFDNDETFFGLSATRRFDRFTLGLESSLGIPTKTYSVALRLGFSLGRQPFTRKPFIERPGLATSGAIAIRAFRDNDGDDRFGPGDTILPGVSFSSGTAAAVTNKDGIATIGDLPSGSRAILRIDADSLPDISLAPKVRGIEIVPRSGRIHVTDFPIIETSDLQGMVQFDRDGHKQAVSGLRLELVDAQSKVVARAKSESDGYVLFEQVPPGEYHVRIDADQLRRFGIALEEDRPVQIKAGKVPPALNVLVSRQQ